MLFVDITGIYHEKRATIISASISKYIDGIRGCTTHAFPGATIGRITKLLSRGKINISNIDIFIIHVGTNNISSCGYNHFLLWGFNTQT